VHASISPVWDGNETWLVLIGASLLGAFPMIYAIFLSAFYIPVTLLLFALIFRGVSFELRHQAPSHRGLWDWGLIAGSAIATFSRGRDWHDGRGAASDRRPICQHGVGVVQRISDPLRGWPDDRLRALGGRLDGVEMHGPGVLMGGVLRSGPLTIAV